MGLAENCWLKTFCSHRLGMATNSVNRVDLSICANNREWRNLLDIFGSSRRLNKKQ